MNIAFNHTKSRLHLCGYGRGPLNETTSSIDTLIQCSFGFASLGIVLLALLLRNPEPRHHTDDEHSDRDNYGMFDQAGVSCCDPQGPKASEGITQADATMYITYVYQ